MNFQDLHELLRLELNRRIQQGVLTQTSIAHQSGFQQGHISNFLKSKRGLSLDGLDRVLASQDLTLEQIMPLELNASAASPPTDAATTIPVVTPAAAMDEPVLRPASIIETIPLPSSGAWLEHSRSRTSNRRGQWQRFVAIRADGPQAAAMDPVVTPGAIVIIDRHYNTIAPYHAQQRTLYAVRTRAGLALRYVDFDKHALLLRPLALTFPVEQIPLAPQQSPADHLTGRACLILSEL